MYQAIYALPIYLTVPLVVGFALFWRDLRHCAVRDHTHLWRMVCTGGVILWAFLVLYLTHFSRGASSLEPQWIPLHKLYTVLNGGNREILRSAWMNLLLFIPGGVFLYDVLPVKRGFVTAAVCAVLFSTAIEIGQWLLHHGQAETDDILMNTVGAVIGFLLMKLLC